MQPLYFQRSKKVRTHPRTPTVIARDAASGRVLFPDTDATLARFEALKAGLVDHLDCLPSTDR